MDDLTFSIQQLASLVIPPRQMGDFVTLVDTRLEVDGGTEVIGFGFETRASKVAQETMPILQTLLGDVAAKIFTQTIDIPDFARQVDGEIFIRATNTGMDIIIKDDPPMVQDANEVVTPIVEIIDQATIPMLEEIYEIVDPIIGA